MLAMSFLLSGCSLSGSQEAKDGFLASIKDVTDARAPYTNEVDVMWDDFHVVAPTSMPYVTLAPYDKGFISDDPKSESDLEPTLAPIVAEKKTIKIVWNYAKDWNGFLMPYETVIAKQENMPNAAIYKKMMLNLKLTMSGYSKDIMYKLDLSSVFAEDHFEFDSWNKWRLFNYDTAIAVEQNYKNNNTHTGILQQYYGLNILKSQSWLVNRSDLKKLFGNDRQAIERRNAIISNKDLIPDKIKVSATKLKAVEQYSEELKKNLQDTFDIEVISADGNDSFAVSEIISAEQADLCLVLSAGSSDAILTSSSLSYQYTKNQSVLESANNIANKLAQSLGVTNDVSSKNAILLVMESVPCIEINVSKLDAKELSEQLIKIVK